MKVSIITAVMNDAPGFLKTLDSVTAQTHPDIEYIVIDGGSTDGTVETIREHLDKIDVFVSEPDRGISDAWNKGVARASGEIIGILNAADEYEPGVVAAAVAAIEGGADVVFGDTDLVDRDGVLMRRCSGRFSRWRYSGGVGFHHPSLLSRAKIYREIGAFDVKLRLAMDSDWIFRALRSGARFRKGKYRLRMEADGVSVKNRFSAYGEHLDSMRRNGISEPLIALNMIVTGARRLAALGLGRL